MGRERLIFIILIISIILLFNFIISTQVLRIDLTEDNRYTISESTREILLNMDDVVNIDVYFSRDLPPQFRNLDEEVRNLLQELQAYARRNLNIEFHDPQKDSDTEQRMYALQIPKVRANIIEKDRAQVVELYLGMVIYYQDKKEVIPVVQSVANLEYEILSKILKVKEEGSHKIRLIFDPGRYQGPAAQMMGHNILEAMFAENFIYDAVPAEKGAITDDIDLLLVLPVDVPDESFLYELDQYIISGRPAAFFIGGMSVHQDSMMASPYDSPILNMLEHYGIKVDNSLVLDTSNSMASFRTEFGFFSTEYPFWVSIRPDNINRENPVTSGLENLILPYVSPVTFISDSKGHGGVSHPLFTSSRISYRKYAPIHLNPQQDFGFRRDMDGYIPLGVLYNEGIESYFEEKLSEDQSDHLNDGFSNIAVIGSEHILYDFFFQNNDNNIVFIQNLVDFYTIGEALIGIRAKQLIQRPLKELSDIQRSYIKWTATLFIPGILLVFGIIKMILKNHYRNLAMRK